MKRAGLMLGVVAVALGVTPLLASATHDERPEAERTAFEPFAAEMQNWLGPWLDDPSADLLEGVAGLSGWAVGDALADISPQPCYRDAYMRFWHVQADMWHMSKGPDLAHKAAAEALFHEDLAIARGVLAAAAIQCALDPNEQGFSEAG